VEPAVSAPREVVLGLLHTGAMHPPVFDALVAERIANDERLRGAQQVHVSDAWLLDTAIADGVTPPVVDRIEGHIRALAERGATAVLITCSSIGEATEQIAESAPIPVVRVDTAMAAAAVAEARRRGSAITVLATLASTLGPTTRLIEREAAGGDATDLQPTVRAHVIEGAVARREAGDQAGHDALIADAIAEALAADDVVVLAQASMARAVPAPDPRVFSSPESSVEALLAAARTAL
jgi:hypothetical protein